MDQDGRSTAIAFGYDERGFRYRAPIFASRSGVRAMREIEAASEGGAALPGSLTEQ